MKMHAKKIDYYKINSYLTKQQQVIRLKNGRKKENKIYQK